MKLSDLAGIFSGNYLFSVRENVTVNEETKERIIISFKSGEQEALKDTLLDRTIKKVNIEVNKQNAPGAGVTYNPLIVALLNDAV